jgi:uncharacterized protein
MRPAWYYWEQDTLFLRVRIQPKAARTEIVGPLGDELKIRVTAPPAEGEANECLIAFLAKFCRVAKSSVELLSGASSRNKLVSIRNPARLPDGVQYPSN